MRLLTNSIVLEWKMESGREDRRGETKSWHVFTSKEEEEEEEKEKEKVRTVTTFSEFGNIESQLIADCQLLSAISSFGHLWWFRSEADGNSTRWDHFMSRQLFTIHFSAFEGVPSQGPFRQSDSLYRPRAQCQAHCSTWICFPCISASSSLSQSNQNNISTLNSIGFFSFQLHTPTLIYRHIRVCVCVRVYILWLSILLWLWEMRAFLLFFLYRISSVIPCRQHYKKYVTKCDRIFARFT